MNSKQITFDYLDELREGFLFRGIVLQKEVCKRAGKLHYPDTILRYMREWRKNNKTHNIILVSKPESLYMKVAKV